MKSKHKKTLTAIFTTPTGANIKFRDIESLVIALGGEVRESAGSRVLLAISGKREYAHRPHPGKEAKRYIVERLREWLISLEASP